MKIKTADLIGAPLDWAVCVAKGLGSGAALVALRNYCGTGKPFSPSTSGSEVIDIMEREKIDVQHHSWGVMAGVLIIKGEERCATYCGGPTLRIAVCRCFCASKLGDEVEVPDELVKEN